MPLQLAALGGSKRFVARCQFNALDGQIGSQAVYLGQPCGFCVGKLLGDAPGDKEAGEGVLIELVQAPADVIAALG